jgi:hypothetical protein
VSALPWRYVKRSRSAYSSTRKARAAAESSSRTLKEPCVRWSSNLVVPSSPCDVRGPATDAFRQGRAPGNRMREWSSAATWLPKCPDCGRLSHKSKPLEKSLASPSARRHRRPGNAGRRVTGSRSPSVGCRDRQRTPLVADLCDSLRRTRHVACCRRGAGRSASLGSRFNESSPLTFILPLGCRMGRPCSFTDRIRSGDSRATRSRRRCWILGVWSFCQRFMPIVLGVCLVLTPRAPR